ncbi:hypothetical protein CROQUDRAFT_38483 [Cronartium quercuum f. sp. fusiforme G11]|uniref:Ribosome biogenesis regulatory protein n=1 Tax=Cronartium quercuum f. sp. fusiforme G11 TaxID=708437 RepID=A0A9P6NVS7_9BASI|nr:hypothetical protein CROQUDRAFT_38483 [Cronartium quercuum f. sp. fusiforme G11]
MADVSHILALKSQKKSVIVSPEIPIDLDVGLLAAFDPNPIDSPEYNTNREEYLQSTARDAVQTLINALFSLPTVSTNDGVLATLPASGPSTILPRAKPLPKPAPLTKWQKFANDKGIAPKAQRDKVVFDEEKQEWVNKWGWKGKNKDEETAWIREVKAGEADEEGGLERNKGKRARKERTLKNEKQRLKNVQRANAEIAKTTTTTILATANRSSTTISNKADARLAKREEQASRKGELQGLIQSTKKSTASLGKFDKKFASEPKPKGMKRKFEPTELPAKAERSGQLAVIDQLTKNPSAFKEKVAKRGKKTHSNEPGETDKTQGLLNTRKAIRAVTGGRGFGSSGGGFGKSEKLRKKA